MPRGKDRSFGQVIRERRRQLDLTQEDVARRIKTSTPYVGHLESGKRHPSDRVLSRLAEVLLLDTRDLFLLANPQVGPLLDTKGQPDSKSAWSEFRKDERVRRIHNITEQEMEALSRVALMGEVRSKQDFIYILNTIRQALGR
ncbi:MAG: helix-turn-helix transcriptional regulator [Candidatus Binataceae bacterium]